MLDTLWRTPARLFRRNANDNGPLSPAKGVEVAQGPLEDMLKLVACSDNAEASLLFIDCKAAEEPLDWAKIRTLLAEPSFPIEI